MANNYPTSPFRSPTHDYLDPRFVHPDLSQYILDHEAELTAVDHVGGGPLDHHLGHPSLPFHLSDHGEDALQLALRGSTEMGPSLHLPPGGGGHNPNRQGEFLFVCNLDAFEVAFRAPRPLTIRLIWPIRFGGAM
jgi:hypothetical protein